MSVRTPSTVEHRDSVRSSVIALLGFALALLIALALAASAHAAEPGEQSGTLAAGAEGQTQSTATEGQPSSGGEAPAPTSSQAETSTPTETGTPSEGTTTAPPASEETVTTQSPSASEETAQAIPTQEATQTPSEEAAPTTPSETTQPVTSEETAGPILVSEEVSSPTHGAEEILAKVTPVEEDKTASSLEETTIVGHGGANSSGGQGSTVQAATSTQPSTAAGIAEGAAQPIADAMISTLGARTEDGGGPRVPPSAGEGAGTSKTGTVVIAGGADNDPVCALASLERRMPGICSGWLSTQRVLSSASIAAAITAGSSRGQTDNSDGGNGRGPSVASTPPASPTPGPPPAGAGGAAAAGGPGVALSGFFSLAGLLLLAAPLAMRRLRLSFRLWRASCVALIPERPG
jgi:hypothetical protein